MLFFLTSILSLTAIAADFIHFRRRRRRKLPVRRALVAWVAATDALPTLSSLIGALSRDNGPELMYLCSGRGSSPFRRVWRSMRSTS